MRSAPGRLLAMIRIKKAFDYAYDGIHVKRLEEGAEIDDNDQAAAVALAENWGKKVKGVAAQPDPEPTPDPEPDPDKKPDPDPADNPDDLLQQ